MPRGDGTGPDGKGPKKVNKGLPSKDGRGQGRGRGVDKRGGSGRGQGRGNNK